MKLRRKIVWPSIVPFCLKRKKSATRFSIFSKVKSNCRMRGNTPVYLNVYDLTSMNRYVYWAGLGIFHSAVEVHGVEYAFGAHDFPMSGVFELEPRQCPGFKFRKSIFVGMSHLDTNQVKEFMDRQAISYHGDTYHLIRKNCNHFSEDICRKLTGNRIPKWVNRLAKIGSVCKCVLPKALRTTSVRHNRDFMGGNSEEKKMKPSFSCLQNLSYCGKEISLYSLFLHSRYMGCMPPWESTKSKPGLLKET